MLRYFPRSRAAESIGSGMSFGLRKAGIDVGADHHDQIFCSRRRRFGRPDFVFPAAHVAVFVDGCFWHGCPAHGQIPASNRRFWKEKINRNIARDIRITRKLRRLGWHVFRVWEHNLGKPLLNRKLGRLRRIVGAGRPIDRAPAGRKKLRDLCP